MIFLFLVMHPGQILAATIFQCIGDDGVVRFQDMHCHASERSRTIELPDSPDGPRVDPPTYGESKSENSALSTAPVQSRPVVESSVSATLCTREDGSRYLSDSGRGQQRAVSLGMLGVPRDSLADAYAGRDGIGVSAPGLRNPPSDRSAYGQLGAMYTWVEDPCSRINGAQLCAFLGERIDDAERRLRFAFSDTSEQVRLELESLRERAQSCPR